LTGAEPDVRLREVVDDDLRLFYEFQLDPMAAAMAVFPSQVDLEVHRARWQTKILGNPDNIARTVLADGRVAGNMLCWPDDGRRLVGYWIGREFWGRGIGTAALRLFTAEIRQRPLHAMVAVTNAGSQRVLEKAGFRQIERHSSPEDGVAEFVYRLD
jgi:RimJ/RimL family protein N-acetyltransferase